MAAKSLAIGSLVQEWLLLQCRLLPGVSQAMVLIANSHQEFQTAAAWPKDKAGTPALLEALNLALKHRRGVLGKFRTDPAGGTLRVGIAALPIVQDGNLIGAVAWEVVYKPEMQQKLLLTMLQWGIAWLTMLLKNDSSPRLARLESLTTLITDMLAHKTLKAGAASVATFLADRLPCERVSIGIREGKESRLIALSQGTEFQRRENLVRNIEAAMDEALDQDQIVTWPAVFNDQIAIQRAHQEFSRATANHCVATIPMMSNQRLMGAITLERPNQQPFDQSTLSFCQQVASVLGPLIETQQLAEQTALLRAVQSCKKFIGKLLSTGHFLHKFFVVSVLGLVVFLATAKGDFLVRSPARLEGTIQRVVISPRDGFIGSAYVTAGDVVKEGQLLATLDDKDILLEQAKIESQKQQLDKKIRSLMADHNRAEISVINAQLEQSNAQLALIEEQLKRGKMLAPFSGFVVKGDLSQSLGAPVKRGDSLFEIAPLNSYRVILKVFERDVADLYAGQQGKLVLAAQPHDVLTFTIEKVTPVASVEEGLNNFRVEAKLHENHDFLRPGMEGVAKVIIGERKLIWIWTHDMVNWLRLKSWSWLP